jgi:hypothetical protein
VLTEPMKVILDIRKDIEKFQNGGSRKELVDALRDQFIATRYQAATKAEAVRILALNMLQARVSEMKSNPELLKTITALSESSENDLAAVLGVLPGMTTIPGVTIPGVTTIPGIGAGQGTLINLQQMIGLEPNQRLATTLPEREDKASNPIRDASHVLEAYEHLSRYIKEVSPSIRGRTRTGMTQRPMHDHHRRFEFLAVSRTREMRFIEAIDLAHRFGAKTPELHEDDPRAVLWIDRIAELSLAQQQGRLAQAIAEVNRCAE